MIIFFILFLNISALEKSVNIFGLFAFKKKHVDEKAIIVKKSNTEQFSDNFVNKKIGPEKKEAFYKEHKDVYAIFKWVGINLNFCLKKHKGINYGISFYGIIPLHNVFSDSINFCEKHIKNVTECNDCNLGDFEKFKLNESIYHVMIGPSISFNWSYKTKCFVSLNFVKNFVKLNEIVVSGLYNTCFVAGIEYKLKKSLFFNFMIFCFLNNSFKITKANNIDKHLQYFSDQFEGDIGYKISRYKVAIGFKYYFK